MNKRDQDNLAKLYIESVTFQPGLGFNLTSANGTMYIIDPGYVRVKDTSSPVVAGSGGYVDGYIVDGIQRAAHTFKVLNTNPEYVKNKIRNFDGQIDGYYKMNGNAMIKTSREDALSKKFQSRVGKSSDNSGTYEERPDDINDQIIIKFVSDQFNGQYDENDVYSTYLERILMKHFGNRYK
jgi:hypothetical protein